MPNHPLQHAIDVCPTEEEAALVAAASQMLAALKHIQTWLLEDGLVKEDGIWNPLFVKANNAAAKAIAAAEGRGHA